MKKIIMLMMVLMLSSCASLHYGNFTKMTGSKDDVLVSDAANRIVKIYPPARNTFKIYQRVCDGFGLKLIDNLRRKGYGVVENVRYKQQSNFSYVVDESNTNSKRLYRVTIYIGSQSISRGYVTLNGKLKPVTSWTHKE